MKNKENEKKLIEIIQRLKMLLKDLKKNKIPENLENDLLDLLFKKSVNVFDADQIINVEKYNDIRETITENQRLNPDPWLFEGIDQKGFTSR